MLYVCIFNKNNFSSTDNTNDKYFDFCNKLKVSTKKTSHVNFEELGEITVYVRKEKNIKFCCIANNDEKIVDCVNFLKQLKPSDDLLVELKTFNYRNNPILECQDKVDEVKNMMIKNVNKVIERGEQLKDIDEKVQQLEFNSEEFRQTSRALKRPFIKKIIIYLIIIFAIVLVIVVFITVLILIAVGVIEIVKKETIQFFNFSLNKNA